CDCPPSAIRRYQARLSGPLLDRVDLRVVTDRVTRAELTASGARGESTATVAARVRAARERAATRFAGTPWHTNSDIPGRELRSRWRAAPGAMDDAERSLERGVLTARGIDRVLRFAWTVADLVGHDRPDATDVAPALQLRTGITRGGPMGLGAATCAPGRGTRRLPTAAGHGTAEPGTARTPDTTTARIRPVRRAPAGRGRTARNPRRTSSPGSSSPGCSSPVTQPAGSGAGARCARRGPTAAVGRAAPAGRERQTVGRAARTGRAGPSAPRSRRRPGRGGAVRVPGGRRVAPAARRPGGRPAPRPVGARPGRPADVGPALGGGRRRPGLHRV